MYRHHNMQTWGFKGRITLESFTYGGLRERQLPPKSLDRTRRNILYNFPTLIGRVTAKFSNFWLKEKHKERNPPAHKVIQHRLRSTHESYFIFLRIGIRLSLNWHFITSESRKSIQHARVQTLQRLSTTNETDVQRFSLHVGKPNRFFDAES